MKEVLKENYSENEIKLEKYFDDSLENNSTFKKIATKLKLPKDYLMKYTTKLEDTSKELDNCKNCKNLNNCNNSSSNLLITAKCEGV